ncbi:MAG: ECF transporter S component [Clostridia bacterium]|nr:ECF transporter S component [Clostridia bacterium]
MKSIQSVARTPVSIRSTRSLTLLAMCIAVLVVLSQINIPQPAGLSITFNMIPVAIAAIALGMPGGAIVGGAFGLISFLQCFGILGYSAMGAALVNVSPFLMLVQRFGSRILVGILSALVYRLLSKTGMNHKLVFTITGFSAAFFNTLLFMTTLVLLFGHSEYMQGLMAGRSVLAFIIASVGINAVVEMVVSALVTGGIATALRKASLL